MSDDDDDGSQHPADDVGYVFLRIAHTWLWWFRGVAVLAFGLVWLMHELGPLAIFLGGVLFGICFDRFVLWPLAILATKVTGGRFRSG